MRRGLLEPEVRVTTRGGDLLIRWPRGREAPGETDDRETPAGQTNADRPVMMTGDAVRVFDGEIDL